MQLKALKRLGSDEIVTLSDQEIFNPTINQFWGRTNNEMRSADYFAQLKAVFCRENLLTEAKWLIPTMSNDEPLRTAILNALPDEDLWTLYQVGFNGYAGGRSGRRTEFAYFHGSIRTVSNGAYISYTDAFAASPMAFTDPTWPEWFLTSIIKPIKDSYGRLFRDMGESSFARDNHAGFSSLWQMFHHFMCAGKIFNDARGSHLTTAKVSEALLLDPEGATVKTIWGPYGISLKLFQKITRANKSALHQIFNYSTDVLSMLEYPIKAKGEFDPVLYGVELEVSTDYSVAQIIDATDLPYMLAKSDGSITGSKRHAMELVTVPMSLKAHKQQWAKWFSKLDYDKFDTTKSTSNGMHVHIGREFFKSSNHRRSFLWFINNPSNFDFFMALSERTVASMQQYSRMAMFTSSTKKTTAFRRIEDFVSATGRHTATNLQKGPTIEVRLFRGIVSYASVLKNLEAVDALFHYTMDLPVTEGSLSNFLTWIQKTPPNKYTVLKKFIAMTKMDEILIGSQIKDILFTEDKPKQVIDLLKKSGLKITSAHVTYLNRSKKKRTYILDKKTGELTLVMNDQGKVAALDRQLEQRYVNAA